jgi:hypothetical protein
MKERAHLLILLFTGITGAILNAQDVQPHRADMPDCPMHSEHAKGVDERGDKGMGFSHEKTTHHFRLMNDGGAIEVTADNVNDEASRDQIRTHLAHISKLFTAGDFQIPMFVHDQIPPGAIVMKQKKDRISYRYEMIDAGARLRITTADPEALKAVHEFLRFQITDHRTGDSLDLAK